MVKYFGTGDVISCHVIQSGRPFSLFSGNMEAVLSDIVAPEDLLVSFYIVTHIYFPAVTPRSVVNFTDTDNPNIG